MLQNDHNHFPTLLLHPSTIWGIPKEFIGNACYEKTSWISGGGGKQNKHKSSSLHQVELTCHLDLALPMWLATANVNASTGWKEFAFGVCFGSFYDKHHCVNFQAWKTAATARIPERLQNHNHGKMFTDLTHQVWGGMLCSASSLENGAWWAAMTADGVNTPTSMGKATPSCGTSLPQRKFFIKKKKNFSSVPAHDLTPANTCGFLQSLFK